MKIFKKAAALLLAAVLLFTFAACHPKDEVAVSVGEHTLTSAMYSYYLFMADGEAKNKIDEDPNINVQAPTFSYYDQKIENKPFETYVKELALEKCLNHIAVQKLCAENKIVPTKAEIENNKLLAQQYWYSGDPYQQGFSPMQPILEPNGISLETFEKILLNDVYASKYFEKLYGEGGSKEVTEETLKKTLSDRYAAIHVIIHDYSGEGDVKVADVKAGLEKYVTALKDGTSFEDVNEQYEADQKAKEEDKKEETEDKKEESEDKKEESEDKKEESEDKKEESEDKKEESEDKKEESEDKKDENKPEDENIRIITDNTEFQSQLAAQVDWFSKVKEMKTEDVKLIEDVDSKAVYIVVKKDITKDAYYFNNLKDEILKLLKEKEFDNHIATTASKMQYSVNGWAIDQFKVRDIKYPEATSTPTTTY